MSFRFKIILLFSVLAAVFIGGLVYYLDFYLRDYVKKQTLNHFRVVAEISENAYLASVESLKTRTVDWSSDGYIRDTTEKILNTSGEDKNLWAQALGAYLRDVKIHYDPTVVVIDVLDQDGVVIASSRGDRTGEDEKVEEEKMQINVFDEAIKGGFGSSFVSRPVIEINEFADPITHAMARIFSNEETVDSQRVPLNAVLLLHFANTSRLSDMLAGKWQIEKGAPTGRALYEYYKTAEIYLVGKDKNIITPLRFIDRPMSEYKVDTKPVRDCLGNKEEIAGEYKNYAGLDVVGASTCLKSDNMTLIAEAQSKEIFQSLADLRRRLIAAGVFTWLASAIIIMIFTNLILRNLNSIVSVAEEVADGNLSARSYVSSGDEIGRLADAFNQALDSAARSQRDLKIAEVRLKEINVSLEEKILERTVELEDLKKSLEEAVAKKTEELHDRLSELEKFKRVTVGRELKMIELKKEISKLTKLT